MRRQRTLCGIRIKSFGTLFVSAPCAETPTCAILIETKVSSTNHIEAAAKELEVKLLPRGDDSDVEIVDGVGGEAEGGVVEL